MHIHIFDTDNDAATSVFGRRLKIESHSAKWRRNKYAHGVYNNVLLQGSARVKRVREERFYSITPLLICRQIYAEAHLMPYALNIFSFHSSAALNRWFLYRIGEVNRRALHSIVLEPHFKIAPRYQRSISKVQHLFLQVRRWSIPGGQGGAKLFQNVQSNADEFRKLLSAESLVTQYGRFELTDNTYDEFQELRGRGTGSALVQRIL